MDGPENKLSGAPVRLYVRVAAMSGVVVAMAFLVLDGDRDMERGVWAPVVVALAALGFLLLTLRQVSDHRRHR